MYSVRYYLLVILSLASLIVSPTAFYFYATAADKDSQQGFFGAMGTIIFFALFLILQVYSYRQADIDSGIYVPPDRKWKKGR